MNYRFSFFFLFFRYRYSARTVSLFLPSVLLAFAVSLLVIIRDQRDADATWDAWIARIERMYEITVI